MLTVDPKRRVTAADALKHKWISVSKFDYFCLFCYFELIRFCKEIIFFF